MSHRVLIVEDDEELQEIYGLMLEDLDCHVVRANDGLQGLEELAKEPPDLVVLDILLREMMGDAFYQEMRQDARYAHIPVVVVSVLSANQGEELMDMDARTVFLRKPFRKDQLLEAVVQGLAWANEAPL